MSNATHPPLSVRLDTRENCPLCDEMRAQLDLAGLGVESVELVDISRDAGAEQRFRSRAGSA